MFENRETQLRFGGSFTLAFADQVLFDKEEYFDHLVNLIISEPRYSSGRDVRKDMLYESFFISLFAYLESMTGQACNDLATILHKNIRLCDLNERSKFEGIRKYLSLVADTEFPTATVFKTITDYRKVRNVLAHGNSLIDLRENYKKVIKKLPGIECDEDGDLVLTPEFCKSFIAFCRMYVKQLKSVSENIVERAKRKVTVVT